VSAERVGERVDELARDHDRSEVVASEDQHGETDR